MVTMASLLKSLVSEPPAELTLEPRDVLSTRKHQGYIVPHAFIQDLQDQAEHPPGGDIVMAACYSATVDLINEDPAFRNYLGSILTQRTFTPQHFTNLYF